VRQAHFALIFPHKRFLKLIGVEGNLSKRSGRMEAYPRTTRGCAKSYFP
jgi:hypothetical protein